MRVVHRVAHVIEFAVLGALTLRALSKDGRITKRELIITLIIVALYGASDEFHQRFTPGRSVGRRVRCCLMWRAGWRGGVGLSRWLGGSATQSQRHDRRSSCRQSEA